MKWIHRQQSGVFPKSIGGAALPRCPVRGHSRYPAQDRFHTDLHKQELCCKAFAIATRCIKTHESQRCCTTPHCSSICHATSIFRGRNLRSPSGIFRSQRICRPHICVRADCLRSYHREWDPKLKRFNPKPKHDWASHGADSFMAAAVAYRQGLLSPDMNDYNDEWDDEYYEDDTRNSTT